MNETPTELKQDTEPDSTVTRRSFVKVGVATLVGACYAAALGYPVYEYLAAAAEKSEAEAATKEITLNDVDKLPAPGVLMFKFGGRPALLIHHADHSWTALSAVCTHLGCTVQFDSAKDGIFCACHGGTYNAATGANVSGPPPKPLTLFHVVVNNGKAVVSRA